MFAIAQMFSAVSLCLNIVSFQFKSKQKILAILIFANIFYMFSFLFLSSLTGVITVFVATIRTGVFYYFENKKLNIPKLIFWLFIIINTIVGFIILENYLGLLPIVGVNILTYALYQKNEIILKYLVILYCICFIIFNILLGGFINIFLESMTLMSACVFLIRHYAKGDFFKQQNKL